jgi:hypothetical protein
VFLKEVDLELTGEAFVAYRSDYLDLRSENLEYDVEAYLVISCSGTSVSYCSSSDLLDVSEDFKCLENAL